MTAEIEPSDPWGLEWVHQVYRRQFRLLTMLIPGVDDGDTDRSSVVAEHLEDMTSSLLEHHSSEDDLLWPKVQRRVDLETGTVERMSRQHDVLREVAEHAAELGPRWSAGAEAPDRDELARLVSALCAANEEHFRDEETHALPLVRQHITPAEWDEFEVRGHESVPENKALLFLGLGLEDATPREKERFIGGLPPEVQRLWESGDGLREYARLKSRIHGTG
jgi:hemerythrin-like domain-containing protein